MIIIPAIDLYQGKAVRLVKGVKADCKVYSSDPFSLAEKWRDDGASWLHLVDLSAAFSEGNNKDIIAQIAKSLDISVEVGGGIRSLDLLKEIINFGVDRIILGTAATDPSFLKQAVKEAGEKLAVAVDEKNGKVAVSGWEKSFDMSIGCYLDYLSDCGVRRVIYTDTSCDGTLAGPNLTKIEEIKNWKQFSFILSGGVSCLEDIRRLKKEASFAEGVIVGKALYEQKFKLKEAINVLAINC